jgi:hypothetical protein
MPLSKQDPQVRALAHEVLLALAENGHLAPLRAELRLEAFRAILPSLDLATRPDLASPVLKATAKLVEAWLEKHRLVHSLAALRLEADVPAWQGPALDLASLLPPFDMEPPRPYAAPNPLDPATRAAHARVLARALVANQTLAPINAKLRNMVHRQFKQGGRSEHSVLTTPEQLRAATVVDKWLGHHRLTHTQDILRCETGLSLDGFGLAISLEDLLGAEEKSL